uniref:Uncharacterized protein n=1 Tax=Rhizophora mucronata TaxID=61149 RepID=A0A2P2MM43_RHIMU
MEVGLSVFSPNKFSNNFGAIRGRFMGCGAMKLTIFSWTLYLILRLFEARRSTIFLFLVCNLFRA